MFENGARASGIYQLNPVGATSPFNVECVFNQAGAWTVIQRRGDDSTSFVRNWLEYKQGFGTLRENFWLGLDHMHILTNQRQYTLRIDLTNFQNQRRHAMYKYFVVKPESMNYQLEIAQYSGTAGDSLGYHNKMAFSTFERDNDKKDHNNCADQHKGGWWYRECDRANLNGLYYNEPRITSTSDDGIEWDKWAPYRSLKGASMMIKRTYTDSWTG